jgi:hypothetical protein
MRNRLRLALTDGPAPVSVTPEMADRFLCELANVPEYDDSPDGPNATRGADGAIHVEMPNRVSEAWQRIEKLFPELLPKRGNPIHERPHRWFWEAQRADPRIEKWNPRSDAPGLVWQDPDEPDYIDLLDIAPKLSQVWRFPNVESRKVFLMCELVYYLRGPATFAVATKAHEAEVEERRRAENEGVTAQQAWSAGYERWSEVLRREATDPAKTWIISDADAFAQVLLRAIDVAPLMRNCSNPACPAPRFIAAKKSQRFCSDVCALPAQREWKRSWWRQNGSNYRGRKNRKPCQT